MVQVDKEYVGLIFDRDPHESGVLNLSIIVGGKQQAALLYGCDLGDDIVVGADSDTELSKALCAGIPPGVIPIWLAHGQTIAMLRRHGLPGVEASLTSRPAISLTSGMGQ